MRKPSIKDSDIRSKLGPKTDKTLFLGLPSGFVGPEVYTIGKSGSLETTKDTKLQI